MQDREEDRQPACVRTCPTGARHFGDFADPDSKVSRLSAERGGYALMPELGYKPVNRYLPPRAAPVVASAAPEAPPMTPLAALSRLMARARDMLSG